MDDYGPPRGLFGLAVKWWLWILGIVIVLVVIGTPVGFALGWFNRGVQVVSPENVQQQWQQGYDYYNALKGTAQNICTLQTTLKTEPLGSDAYNQRESQLLAQQQLYETNSRHYNAFMQDPLRAKVVRPQDLPAAAPTATEMEREVCAG
jgi:hypothetical protein